jgi:hypothetical protein
MNTPSKTLLRLIFISLLASCTPDNKEEKPIENAAMTRTAPFTLPTELATLKTDIRRMDLRKVGYEDALVTVFPKDSMGARIGFEKLQIFEFDTTKQAFVKAHEEKVYYGKSFDVRDVDGDGTSEICIQTDGGGNSALASLGLTILKKQNGKYSRAASFDAGNPEIISLPNGEKTASAVLISDEYWPDYLPHTEAVVLMDSLAVLVQAPEEAAKIRLKFFDEALAKAEQRYADAKSVLKASRSEQAVFNVYTEAVTMLRLLPKSSRSASLQSFTTVERAYWRSMLPSRLQQALSDVFLRQAP